MSRGERKATIRREHPELSLGRQCRLLAISRSSFYYTPKGESPESLALMRRIDELFMKHPFYGSRQMVRQLWRDGFRVGRHRVRRLMRFMAWRPFTKPREPAIPIPRIGSCSVGGSERPSGQTQRVRIERRSSVRPAAARKTPAWAGCVPHSCD